MSDRTVIGEEHKVAWQRLIELLGEESEEAFDRFTRLTASVLGVPVSLFSIVQNDRQFFKSQQGLPEPWASARATPISHSFCRHVVENDRPLVVRDSTLHPSVSGNPAIDDLNVRSYLGVPVRMPDGTPVGALCAIDTVPREWSETDARVIEDLARSMETEIRLRQELRDREQRLLATRDTLIDRTRDLSEAVDRARAERELAGRVLDGIMAFAALLDLDGRVVEVNQAPLDVAGLRREQVVGEFFWRTPWWQPSPGAPAMIRWAFETARAGRAVRFDVQALLGGELRTIDFQIAPLYDEQGRVTHVIPSAVDVEERVQAQRGLREETQRLELAMIAGGMGAWAYDLVSGEVNWDGDSQRIYGFDRDELTIDDVFERIHPLHRDEVAQAIEAAKSSGEISLEFRLIRENDGAVRWAKARGRVQFDGRGQERVPVRMNGVVADVTEDKLARQKTERLSTIVEQASDLVASAEPDGRLIYLNAAGRRAAGLSLGQALDGLKLQDLMPNTVGRAILHEAFPTALAEGSWRGEADLLVARGEGADGRGAVPFSLALIGHLDAWGRPLWVSVIARDISEQRELENQRELLNRELTHRVKNTLAVVISLTRQTARRSSSVEEHVEALTGRLGALSRAHDLLVASSWQDVSLRQLIDNTLEPHFGEQAERLLLRVEDMPLKPTAAQNMGLLFHELATNALKHGAMSGAAGVVELTCERLVKPMLCGQPALRIAWRERDGPPVAEPSRRGFGTTLIERLIGSQHKGKVEIGWAREGFSCTICLPQAELTTLNTAA